MSAVVTVQLVFLLIFLLEDTLNLIANRDRLSQLLLEFVIDVTAIVQNAEFGMLSFVSAFKGIRLFWLLESQSRWSNYKILASAVNTSINQLVNLFVLWALYVVAAAVIGRWLFKGKLVYPELFNEQFDPRTNFDDMLWSMKYLSVHELFPSQFGDTGTLRR